MAVTQKKVREALETNRALTTKNKEQAAEIERLKKQRTDTNRKARKLAEAQMRRGSPEVAGHALFNLAHDLGKSPYTSDPPGPFVRDRVTNLTSRLATAEVLLDSAQTRIASRTFCSGTCRCIECLPDLTLIGDIDALLKVEPDENGCLCVNIPRADCCTCGWIERAEAAALSKDQIGSAESPTCEDGAGVGQACVSSADPAAAPSASQESEGFPVTCHGGAAALSTDEPKGREIQDPCECADRDPPLLTRAPTYQGRCMRCSRAREPTPTTGEVVESGLGGAGGAALPTALPFSDPTETLSTDDEQSGGDDCPGYAGDSHDQCYHCRKSFENHSPTTDDEEWVDDAPLVPKVVARIRVGGDEVCGCGKPAVCLDYYNESEGGPEHLHPTAMCDDCCGHGGIGEKACTPITAPKTNTPPTTAPVECEHHEDAPTAGCARCEEIVLQARLDDFEYRLRYLESKYGRMR